MNFRNMQCRAAFARAVSAVKQWTRNAEPNDAERAARRAGPERPAAPGAYGLLAGQDRPPR